MSSAGKGVVEGGHHRTVGARGVNDAAAGQFETCGGAQLSQPHWLLFVVGSQMDSNRAKIGQHLVAATDSNASDQHLRHRQRVHDQGFGGCVSQEAAGGIVVAVSGIEMGDQNAGV